MLLATFISEIACLLLVDSNFSDQRLNKFKKSRPVTPPHLKIGDVGLQKHRNKSSGRVH